MVTNTRIVTGDHAVRAADLAAGALRVISTTSFKMVGNDSQGGRGKEGAVHSMLPKMKIDLIRSRRTGMLAYYMLRAALLCSLREANLRQPRIEMFE